jgi:hypothetical protein
VFDLLYPLELMEEFLWLRFTSKCKVCEFVKFLKCKKLNKKLLVFLDQTYIDAKGVYFLLNGLLKDAKTSLQTLPFQKKI